MSHITITQDDLQSYLQTMFEAGRIPNRCIVFNGKIRVEEVDFKVCTLSPVFGFEFNIDGDDLIATIQSHSHGAAAIIRCARLFGTSFHNRTATIDGYRILVRLDQLPMFQGLAAHVKVTKVALTWEGLRIDFVWQK